MNPLNSALPPNTVHAARLGAVVLDWAGTTVDFGSMAPVYTLQRVFAQAGVTLTDAETRRDMGLPKKEHIRAIFTLPRVSGAWRKLHGNEADVTDVEALYQQFIPLQLSCLTEHSALIPGVLDAVQHFRGRGLKIGSTTGYTRAMLDVLLESSAKHGYTLDCSVAPEDVGAGRPHPFMMYENAVRLQVSPMSAIVKIGDTAADIQEGFNAGAWTVGVAGTGNGIGLPFAEFQKLSSSESEARLKQSRAELQEAGAHFVVDTLAGMPAVLDDIDRHLQFGR